MLGIGCVGVGEYQSEDPVVCFGAKSTQIAHVQDLPRYRKKTMEGRSQSRTEKWTEQNSWQGRAGVC